MAVAVVAAVLASATAAVAAGDVIVEPAGGSPTTRSIAELQHTLNGLTEKIYVIRSSTGETTEVIKGVPIDRLLDAAGVDPYGYEGVTLTGGGKTASLTRDQLVQPDAFPDGLRPVFWVDAQGVLHYLRPSTAPGDLNGDEALAVTEGAIAVALTKSGTLDVTMAASKKRVKVGERVTFTADVSGADAGEDVVVRWTFGDGRSAVGTRVTHRFTRRGSYKVVVGATSASDPTGGDAFVRIQVGKASTGGPDREGGGTNTAADAPDSGAATGAPGAASAPSAPAPAPTPVSPPAPTPGPPEPPEPPAPKAPKAPPPAEPILPPDQQEAVQQAEPAGAAEQVEGVLLSDASSLPTPATADAIAAARTGTPRAEDPAATGFASVSPVAAGSFAVLALLGLGAWWERRGIPRRADG